MLDSLHRPTALGHDWRKMCTSSRQDSSNMLFARNHVAVADFREWWLYWYIQIFLQKDLIVNSLCSQSMLQLPVRTLQAIVIQALAWSWASESRSDGMADCRPKQPGRPAPGSVPDGLKITLRHFRKIVLAQGLCADSVHRLACYKSTFMIKIYTLNSRNKMKYHKMISNLPFTGAMKYNSGKSAAVPLQQEAAGDGDMIAGK